VLTIAPGEVQIGCDPRWAVRVEGLTEPESDLLASASQGAGLPRTAPGGVSQERWTALLGDLRTAGLLASGRQRPPLPVGEADATAWGLIDPHRHGPARVAARRDRAVRVVGLGPTGLAVAVTLAAAGVGTVLGDDDAPVRSVDVGTSGYRWTDVGATRAEVAARIVRDVAPSVVTRPGADPDLVVLVDPEVADPVRSSALVSAEIAHLSVVVGSASATVGPLVVADGGPCLHCLDLHRADGDPRWARVVTRLATARDRAVSEVGVLAGIAGHLAAALVLAYLDGDHRPVPTTWEVALPDPTPRARAWQAHPACACAGSPARR